MKHTLTLLTALLFAPLAALHAAEATSLEADFRNPPAATKPFVYWYWINNNVSREGLKKDLQAMAQVGIGGVSIAHIEREKLP